MEHGTPITLPEDETFDIGQDTRTPLALVEYRYDAPFKFTGKINKVTFNLGDGIDGRGTGAVHKALAGRGSAVPPCDLRSQATNVARCHPGPAR